MTAELSGTARRDHDQNPVRLRMLVDGQARDASGGAVFSSIDPFTGRPWAKIAEATDADVDAAVGAARRAFDGTGWRDAPAADRAAAVTRIADVIERNAATLGRMETLDTGKPIHETVRQAEFTARVYRYYAGYADKIDGRVVAVENPAFFDFVVHEPVGVCALLTAWNSPMQLLANKLPAALVTGNTVVVRPSEQSPGSTALLAELLAEADLPPGVVNIVTGSNLDVAQRLSRQPGIDLVSLTGGVATGRTVAGGAGHDLKRVVMELGGKSAQVVFDDVDPDRVVEGIVAGIFAAAGQTCIAGSRLLAHHRIVDELTARLVRRAESITLGDPLDPGTQMGPIANKTHFDRVTRFVETGVSEGARLLTGGPLGEGLFVRPTIFAAVHQDMSIVREEIFGPVLVVQPFTDERQAVELANGTDFGLAAGVWTSDLGRALRLSRRLRAGSVWVNTYRQVSPTAPFGGFGQSGIGRERGWEGLLEFVQTKNVMVETAW